LVFGVIANPVLIPKNSALFVLSVRLGAAAIAGLVLLVSAACRKGKGVHLGFIFIYLFWVSISSSIGYAPIISYIKVLNFGVFVCAIWLETKNISGDMAELQRMHNFCFAFCVFIIVSSAALIPFPAYSYLSSLDVMRATGDAAEASAVMAGRGFFDNSLFCGITYQSQALGPLLAIIIVYMILDMFLIRRSGRKIHMTLLVCALPMLYMTRARVGLVAVVGGVLHLFFLSAGRYILSRKIRVQVQRGMIAGGAVLAAILIVGELHSGAVSRFIRKNDDVSADTRTVSEAFTESRMGSVEMNLYDFKRNPLMGSGFQVWEKHRYEKRSGFFSYLSASVEKGLLPLLVLGEGGIVGAVLFLCFCISFYRGCSKNRLVATPCMMTAFLMSNFGEATFFSPGAVGGVLWIISILGGYSLDIISKQNERLSLPW
jgi:hypothetical protein